MTRTAFRNAIGFAFVIVGFTDRAQAQAPPVQLNTLFESFEGGVADQAASTQACPKFAKLDAERLWIAQGRKRSAHGLGQMDRKFAEDRTFSSSAYSFAVERNERVVAVEVDTINRRLYTLTDRGLYRQAIGGGGPVKSSPAKPGPEVFFDLFASPDPLLEYDPTTIPPHLEEVQDLRVWGPASKVLVLTSKRILVLHDSGGNTNAHLSLSGETTDLDPSQDSSMLPLTSCTGTGALDDFNTRNVRFLRRMRVYQDSNGKVMACVLAEATGYLVTIRPKPLILLLCQLDAGLPAWSAPTFDADPSTSVNYAWWDPMPASFPPAGAIDWAAVDLDVAIDFTGARYAYVACGFENQIRRVTLTGAFPRTCASGQTTQLASTKITMEVGRNLRNVVVDRTNPARLAALATTKMFVHQAGLATSTFAQADEVFGLGAPGDLVQVSISTPPTELLYTLCGGVLGHASKVIDFTHNNTSPKFATKKVFGIWGSDGGVMIGDKLFLPTFSGIVKFDKLGSSWQVVPNSYQTTEERPAVPTPFVSYFKGTEHVDLAVIPGQAKPQRIVTASVGGGFDEFCFNTATIGEIDPKIAHRAAAHLFPASWNYPAGPVYGNDIAFFDMGDGTRPGDQIILTDLTFSGNTQPNGRKAALLVWRWDPQVADWRNTVFQETYTFDATLAGAGIPLQDTIDVVRSPQAGGGDKWFAFVTTGESFYSVELLGLNTATPAVLMRSAIACNASSKVRSGGAVAVNDRLFVFVNAFGATPAELRTYLWNTATGVISPTPISVHRFASQSPSSPMYKVLSACRMRADVLNPSTGLADIYIATDSAVGVKSTLLQFRSDGVGQPFLRGYWRSDYEGALQDCRLHKLTSGQKVVVLVKDRESFALVVP